MSEKIFQVVEKKGLTESIYILGIERKNIKFKPCQYLLIGKIGMIRHRTYSIYSGTNDKNLEMLIKEVLDDETSKTLKQLAIGDNVDVQEPLGFFTIGNEILKQNSKFLFTASGTGISPFHSIVRSYSDLDYTILHGIRYYAEKYGISDYSSSRYIASTTGDHKGNFSGKVTDSIRQHDFDKNTHCYLYGNINMIHEAIKLLETNNIAHNHLHA